MQVQTTLLLIALGLAAWGGHIAWRWRDAKAFAGRVYALKQEEGELAPSIDEGTFTDAYIAAEGPRAATYTFVCAVATLVLVPIVMAAFSSLWHQVWIASGSWEPVRRGTMIHVFALFLVAMAVMIGVLGIAMRRYHLIAPPTLKQAIRTLNESASA